MKKIALIVVGFSAILSYLFWKYSPNLTTITFKKAPEVVNLNYWGFEDEKVIKEVVDSYQKTYPKVKINYVRQTLLNYRTRVQTQIRSGVGPDVFQIHNSWVAMMVSDLSPAPVSIITLGEYGQIFYPVAYDSLIAGGKIYALPIEVDGLALYVNSDILKAAGLTLPTTWQEFINTATTVTVKNEQGQIQTAGAALGTTSNIDFWPEILGLLLIQQPKVDFISPASEQAAEVLKFYTSFVVDPKSKTWDVNLASSTWMFINGKLAFYFAPSSQADVIKAANPALNFTTQVVPQLPGRNVGWGSFWAEAVSPESKYPKEAWEFVKFLSLGNSRQLIFQAQTQAGSTGKPYARIDLANSQINDPVLGSFIKQAPYYKWWYLNSQTQDAGINEEIISHYQQAVDATLQGQDTKATLQNISPLIRQSLDKYTKAKQ